MRRKLSLFDYFHIIALSMFVTFTAIFVALTFYDTHAKFEQEAYDLEESYLGTKKQALKREVKRFVDFVESKKSYIYYQTQKKVHARVDEAHALATSLYETYKETLSTQQIQTMIIEALRLMRYEEGKGYYFITRLDGVEMLFADRPEMEGKNMLEIKNVEGRYIVRGMIDLVRATKEGYYEYAWSKPKEQKEDFRKIAYVKLFEPFDWLIGTGLYLDDMERQTKEEITSDIQQLLFDKENNNYIFIGNWQGLILTHPAKNKNMYNIQDVNGKFIVQELIEKAQNGSGFLHYIMPPLQGERALPKVSYVEGINDWEWFVGAGVYLDDINAELLALHEKMQTSLKKSIVSIFWTVAGFSLLLWIFYFYTSRRIKKDFQTFTTFFDSLSKKEEKIVLDEIKFREFDELARHANAMLEAKIQSDQSLERYKKIVSRSEDLLALIDKHYTYLAVSEGYVSFFGKKEDEIVGKTMPELFGAEYFDKELKATSERVLSGESFEREYWVKSPTGVYCYLHTKYFPYCEKGSLSATAYIVSARDVTEKKINEEKLIASEKELEFLAHNDSLTGLPNRLLLHDRITHAVANCVRSGLMLAVCFIDLDNFKKINDSYGHSYGDEILKQFASRIADVIRGCDTLSRIGGDEFILLVENVKEISEIEAIIAKIQMIFTEPFLVKAQKFFLSASIGISLYPEHGLESETLIKNADAAMYKAKDAGKSTYAFYTMDMTIASYERIGLENALREAIVQKQFAVYYQPQIDLKTNTLCGVEALVRWHHPSEGLLMPSRFITLCEETRLIVEIGAFVLEQSCIDLLALHKEGLFIGSVSVNVSGVQIEYSDFLATLEKTICTTGITPSFLEMEVTESFIMNDPERWITLLKNMQRLGVSIAIDDFGTGHSSLSYLRKLPIDKLKVDMSFVRDIPEHEDACAIVKSIIHLAHNMKMVTLAEGIETKAQEHYLEELGCEQGQGYLYAKPMNFKDLKLWIMQRQTTSCKN